MTDVVNRQMRSRMMAGIRSSNTKPEKLVRSALHQRGLRFARSSIGLIGRPDVVLPHWRVAVFVHGCFWHLHKCKLSTMPLSNVEFWANKLLANQARDRRTVDELVASGWRVLTVWECALRGASAKNDFERMMDAVAEWIRGPKTAIYCDVSKIGLFFLESINEGN